MIILVRNEKIASLFFLKKVCKEVEDAKNQMES